MLNEAMQQALASEVVRPVVAAEIQWPDENMRAHTGVGDLYLNTSRVWTPRYVSNGYVSIPLWKPDDQYSIEIDFYLNDSFSNSAFLFANRSAESVYFFPSLYVTGSVQSVNFFGGSQDSTLTAIKGSQNILKAVFDGSDYELTLNGETTSGTRSLQELKGLSTIGAALSSGSDRYAWLFNGQIDSIKLIDSVDQNNSRYYPSIIRSHSKPETLTLKDVWGDGSTDGELIGFTEGDEWEEARGTIPGDTLFHGVGDFGSISAIKQSSGDSPTRLTLGLSAFDDSVRGEVLRAKYQGRPVSVWLVALNGQHQPIASQVIWKGSIVDAGVNIGDSNQIEVTVSNRLEDWDKKRPDRFTDESQQARHKGDRIFRYIPVMAEWPIYWGSDKQATPLRDSI